MPILTVDDVYRKAVEIISEEAQDMKDVIRTHDVPPKTSIEIINMLESKCLHRLREFMFPPDYEIPF